MDIFPPTHRKVLPRKELARRSHALREDGARLVLTNGCFDLLHIGHIRYLAAARALGSALAVGVNSDASVRRLKGPGRPVTPESERAELLAALEAVDFVTIFDEDTATELVISVQPAIYVKGGDYGARPGDDNFPVEGNAVLDFGGSVHTLPYVEGHSTSDILRRVAEPAPPRD